jgi:hypothetical protein
MKPEDALSPRDRIWPGSLKILHISNDRWWSIASLRWRSDADDPDYWEDVIACRWNGELDNPDDKGNPRSHGQGTWFILPGPLAAMAQGLVEAIAETSKR